VGLLPESDYEKMERDGGIEDTDGRVKKLGRLPVSHLGTAYLQLLQE
jgi:hypothetical protein